MRFEHLQASNQHLLLKCISGSKAYNLDLPSSDTDIKGIFVSTQSELYGMLRQEQLSDENNDESYFELRRFIELLTKNNPNILELLSSPERTILYRHPVMNLVQATDFLSKLCFESFAGYAKTQIKKARGLNKKINQPMAAERKTVIDFCYVVQGTNSIPLTEWLNENNLTQNVCGLVNLPHFKDAYLLFSPLTVPGENMLKGIISGDKANDVQLSSTPKNIQPDAILHFNKDGYSVYCRTYNEYWNWVETRNETRYAGTIAHGKNYDAKNMMHTFRLLAMAEEIALHKKVMVHRNDREFLLQIKSGVFEYDQLIEMVEEKMERIDHLYKVADLPESPDLIKAESTLIKMRELYYAEK